MAPEQPPCTQGKDKGTHGSLCVLSSAKSMFDFNYVAPRLRREESVQEGLKIVLSVVVESEFEKGMMVCSLTNLLR